MKIIYIKNDIYYFFHRIFWVFYNLCIFQSLRKYLLRLTGVNISDNVNLLMGVRIIAPWKLKISSGSCINSNCLIDARGGIEIGLNTQIGYGCSIHSMGHKYSVDGFPVFKQNVRIGSNVILFPNVFINPGTTISDGAIVLPGSVVHGFLLENGVYGGNPAKFIKENLVEPTPKNFYSNFGF